MTIASTGGTVTLGLYDTQSQLKEKADITYVDNKVDPLQAGHKGYATLSQAQADQSGLAANTVVEVLSDTTEVNNGYYLWNGTTLTKTTFSPLLQANNYTDSKVATAKAEAIATAASDATTKSNNAATTANNYTDSVFADVPTTLEPYVTQAEAAATAANIAGKVYATPSEGIAPVTGVTNGDYFNVRASSNDNYIDEYLNNAGVAQPTGKSYPSSSFVNSIAEFTALPFKISSSYGINQRVQLTDGDIVKSTVANNTVNPNVDMTGWVRVNDASQIVDESGKSQQEVNDILMKSKDEYVNIFDFCKCDGHDESSSALLAVNRANSRRIPLYIPPNAELLISGTTTLEPMYGIFGGGRIRRLKTGWSTGFAAVLLNSKRAYCDGITFLKHDVAYDDLDNVALTEASPVCGWIEVTKNADGFTITNNKFRGALFNIFQYGGSRGLIHKNESDTTEQAFLNVGLATYYTRPTENVGNISGLVISMNRVRNVSNAPLGGVIGDGIKLMANVQNTVIIGNDIQYCKGDAIDLFASGQDVIIKVNTLAYSGVKNIDIKARYVEYPADVWGRNQQIIIEGNHIFGAGTDGVSVSNFDDNPPMISIINNNIYDNYFNGIWWRGKRGNISGNTIYNNAKSGRAYDCGIKIEGSATKPSSDLNVNSNICVNNGFTGTPAIANNCGIVFFDTVNDCNAHDNICVDSAETGLQNSGAQNFGIYVQSNCKNISLLRNIAKGNVTRQIGWATGAGIIGEKRVLHIGNIGDATKIPFGKFESGYGVVSVRIQSNPLAIDAANYYDFSVDRIALTGGSLKIRDVLSTNTTALSLFGTEVALPHDIYDATFVPLFTVAKTGAPAAISAATVTMNFVTW